MYSEFTLIGPIIYCWNIYYTIVRWLQKTLNDTLRRFKLWFSHGFWPHRLVWSWFYHLTSGLLLCPFHKKLIICEMSLGFIQTDTPRFSFIMHCYWTGLSRLQMSRTSSAKSEIILILFLKYPMDILTKRKLLLRRDVEVCSTISCWLDPRVYRTSHCYVIMALRWYFGKSLISLGSASNLPRFSTDENLPIICNNALYCMLTNLQLYGFIIVGQSLLQSWKLGKIPVKVDHNRSLQCFEIFVVWLQFIWPN